MAIPAILKGDTSGNIVLDILAGYEYTGCTLAVVFNGVRKEFTDLVAGGTKSLQYTADETAGMPLGTAHATLTLTNPAGVVRSMPWVRIRVTDIPSEIYDRHITVDPSQLDVPDATAGDSLAQVKAKLNAVMAFLRGGAACLVACFGLSAFGDLCPTNTLNDVPGDTTISNLVVASGVATGGGGITANDATNAAAAVVVRDVPSWARQANPPTVTETDPTVPAWAKQANPPESMTANALVLTNGAVKTKDGSSTVTAAQVGARADNWLPTAAQIGALTSESDPQYNADKPNLCTVSAAQAMTNAMEGVGTTKRIIRGAFDGVLWDIWVEKAQSSSYADSVSWGDVYGHPTTISGYGITDTYTKTEADARFIGTTQLTNAALQVANQTWDEGYQILWRKVANNGGFYEVCVTNVDLTAGGAQ